MDYGTPETIRTMLVAMAIGLGAGYLIWGWRRRQGDDPDAAPAPRTDTTPEPAAAPPAAVAATATAPAPSTPEDPPVAAQETVPPAAEAPRHLLLDGPPAEIDDLKRIKGVGPKMEAVLHDAGLYQFRQIARLDGADQAWLAETLGTFPGRIARDDWVGQARTLHRETYGSDPD